MSKELKIRMTPHDIENINNEIEIIFQGPTRDSGVQKYDNRNEKYSPEGFHSRPEQAEAQIHELNIVQLR